MRNNKNNTTLRLENIISFFRNITSYFTGKAKIITLVLTIIMLSFTNITLYSSNIFNNPYVSALSYQSSVDVGFTFNPILSVSLSSSDLVISNLVPGNTLDSNVINVSVASNASYGYTLSVIMNGNNSNLTHSNGTNIFSSIATNADLSDLDNSKDTNIWGYSYKDNTVVSPTWSNYNGLSSSNSTTLINTNNNVSSNLDFKIAAKASNTQPSGTYTGIINFTAVSNVAPMSLLDSFIASGAEQLNGYYKMQDMTHDICNNVDIEESELQLIDVRDNKIYWVAKLKDGNCWMTQNLELDLIANSAILNSINTDIDINSYNPTSGAYSPEGGYSKNESNNVVTWSPVRSTIAKGNLSPYTWLDDNNSSCSYGSNSIYYYDISTSTRHTFDSLYECRAAGYTDCEHYEAGNYYNWSAAVASDNTIEFNEPSNNVNNSICPKGWKLPRRSLKNDFGTLSSSYPIDFRNPPLYFTYAGYLNSGKINNAGGQSNYLVNSVSNSSRAYSLYLVGGRTILNSTSADRYTGLSIRCLNT